MAAGMGAICCLVEYAWRNSFWHDEAFIVLNVIDKTATQLLGTLDYQQAAPPLFLLALRSCYVLLGGSEYSLRLVPLLCALAALPVFAWLAWRILGGWAAVWAVALLALANEFIFQSATVKQYSGDILISCLLLALALVAKRPNCPIRRFVVVSLIAAAALWASHPVIFIFGGISLAAIFDLWPLNWRARLGWIAGNLLVLVSFALLYLWSIRLQHDPLLFKYWIERGSFPDYSKPWMLPIWTVDQLISLCNYPFEPMGGLVLLVAIVGVLAFYRGRQWRLLIVTLVPLGLAFAAALVRQFPFGGSRVTLFLLPGLALLTARGIAAIPLPETTSRNWRNFLWLAPAALGAWMLGLATYHLAVPRLKSHMRPAVAFVRQHRRDGEPIYILGRSRDHEFFCYWRHPPPPVHTNWPGEIEASSFWIVTGFNPKRGLRDVEPSIEAARKIARETDRYVGSGGAAIRFKPSDP